jgi:hypothetical protein
MSERRAIGKKAIKKALLTGNKVKYPTFILFVQHSQFTQSAASQGAIKQPLILQRSAGIIPR